MSWRWSVTGLSAAIALSACSSSKPPAPAVPPPAALDLPLSVNKGTGSQYGNYAATVEREVRGDHGELCVIFNWDRPLNSQQAVRLKSASCEARDAPGMMTSHEISREVIPLSQSNLWSDSP